MAVNSTDLAWAQIEPVRKKLPEWFNKFKVALNLIDKGEVQKVNERDFRIPFKTRNGGRPGTYNPNMGSLGRGNRMAGDKMISTFFPFRMAFEFSELDDLATQGELAVRSAVKDALTSGLPEFSQFVDRVIHGSATAVLATATAQTTTSGNTVYTCSNGTGVMSLRRGNFVSVYNTGRTTQRAGGPYQVLSLDIPGKKVTLSGTVPSAAATDELLMEGVSGATPTGPKGIQYFNDYSGTATILGISQASEPEAISNGVDGSGGINHLLLLQLYHKILNRRGEVATGLVGLISPSTQNAIYGQIINVQRYDIDKGNKPKDLLPGIENTISLAGIPHMLDIAQNATRIDWLLPKNWGKAELKPMGFYQDRNGNKFFTLYGGDGAPAAGTWFALQYLADVYCVDMGAEGTIHSIPITSGY